MKIMLAIGLVCLCSGCSGCSRAFMNPNYDKALSEREQLVELEKQTAIFERIAISLESIEKKIK